jgi:hypothetical protein
MPTPPISVLPESVSPGDLITADMFNAMLEALRDAQGSDERFTNLAQEIIDLKAQAKRIEEQLNKLTSDGNILRGRVDRLFIDRDDIRVKLDDLSVTVIPGIRKRFDDIEADIVRRFEPIEDRVTEVELQIVRDSDPIERMSGLTAEQIALFHEQGIQTISDIKTHSADIADIIGNDIEALRITTMVGRVGGRRIG